MEKKLDQNLCKKYPLIFAKRNKSIRESAMAWGFQCGKGWYLLIDILCQSIQNYIDRNKIEQVVCEACKEKFGGLRFYYSGGDEKIDATIKFAENLSSHICETCGKFDTSIGQTGGWIKSLCENCAKSENRKWEKLEVNKEIEKLLR